MQLIYSIFDSAARSYGQPMFFAAPGVMTRVIADEVNRAAEDNSLNRHTADYAVYCIGTFDHDTGTIQAQAPELVHRLIDLKTPA